MFESDPSFQFEDNLLEQSAPHRLDIEAILLTSDLPIAVRTASNFQVFERRMDIEEISRLTEPNMLQRDDPVAIKKLMFRRKTLTEYSGAILVCVLIRLPGVAYTVEIDPETGAIIHWEWERA